jgi:hypothetical protein
MILLRPPPIMRETYEARARRATSFRLHPDGHARNSRNMRGTWMRLSNEINERTPLAKREQKRYELNQAGAPDKPY